MKLTVVDGKISVQIDGIPVILIIDSGASCNAIDRKFWE